LCARILFSCPPRQPKRWSEDEIDPEIESSIAKVLDWLFDLLPEYGEDDQLHPVVIGMTREAKAAYRGFYDAHAEESADLTGELAAAYSKLEETACRLALIIHHVRWAAGDETITERSPVDLRSMEAGIKLCQWFKRETTRVYAILKESDESRERRRLLEWIQKKGGVVTARELARGPRAYRDNPDAAEAALKDLASAGLGTWEFVPSGEEGGRPTCQFRLKQATSGDETPANTADSEGFGSVTSSEEVKNEPPPEDEGGVEWEF
jgi:hypothetical protein